MSDKAERVELVGFTESGVSHRLNRHQRKDQVGRVGWGDTTTVQGQSSQYSLCPTKALNTAACS